MASKSGKSPQQVGKEFEGRIQSILSGLMKTHRMYLVRLYDTTSTGVAGNTLPDQPGDFVVNAYGNPWMIEVKSSEKYESLGENRGPLTGLMKTHQAAAQRLWVRSQGFGLVIFYHQGGSKVELWRGDKVGEAFIKPRESLDFQWCKTIPSTEKAITEALIEILREPKNLFY